MKKEKGHIVNKVHPASIAEEMNIEPGDCIQKINEKIIEDIFDYQFLCEDTNLVVELLKKDGEEWILEIEKEEDEDLGIEFENGLMDEYRRCSNNCIFCFIDQMPKGMRETLYFKDDDARLSFLQGNYITLTNMSDHDIQRIIQYHLSPINISFQTTNRELRCKMLNNQFAGKALDKVELLYQAGISMNGQIVLCKGINDRDELEKSLQDLYRYLPVLSSVSIVPVGLSKFREGLYPLVPFDRQDAVELIAMVERWQAQAYAEFSTHFVHASDEWYILAGMDIPEEDSYDGFCQLENGVGMVRLLLNEFQDAMSEKIQDKDENVELFTGRRHEKISIITGTLIYPYIQQMAERIMEAFPMKEILVIPITNNYFGEHITVTGLLTGTDIIEQCSRKCLGDRMLLPEQTLRANERVLLDDLTVEDIESTLQVKVDIVKSSGYDFVNAFFRKG